MKSLHGSNARFVTKQWNEFFGVFPSLSRCAIDVPEPDVTEGQEVRDSLLEGLAAANLEAVCQRNVCTLVRALEGIDDLTEFEFYVLAKGTLESEIVTKKNSCKMILAIMKLLSRSFRTIEA